MDLRKIVVFILLYSLTSIFALFGFDCSAPRADITQISLTEIGDCNIKIEKPTITKVDLQLLQLNSYSSIHAHYCYIQITRLITRCSVWEDAQAVRKGYATYMKEVTKDECLSLHQTQRITVNGQIIDNVNRNATTYFHTILAGSLDESGNCKGAHYSDQFGDWPDAVVQADGKIILADYDVNVKLDEQMLITPSGIRCPLNKGKCYDHNGGTLFWDLYPKDACDFQRYSVLYEGQGDKIVSQTQNELETVITVTSEDITFALTTLQEKYLCGYTMFRTEHPKLYVILNRKIHYKRFDTTPSVNLDLFNYVNSKFVYIEKHFRAQIETLYLDVLTKRCELERKVLRNSLSIAMQNPDEFALNYMGEVGYTALLGGEIIYLIKCHPVEVTIAKTDKCYQELPVIHDNQTFFLSPRTKILRKIGFETTCNPVLPPLFKIDGAYYKMTPTLTMTTPPHILQPNSTPTWEYIPPIQLAKSGLYSHEDLERLRDYMMQPREQPAIMNQMARISTGQTISTQGLSFGNLIDEDTIQRIVSNTWSRIWGILKGIGDITTGLLGVYMIARLIKLIIDTALHFLSLKAVYGWSFILVGAVWDSLTNFLLHRVHQTRQKQKPNNDQPLTDIQTDKNEDTPETVSSQVEQTPTAPVNNEQKPIYSTVNQVYPAIPPRAGPHLPY